jgi:hypothetical protein
MYLRFHLFGFRVISWGFFSNRRIGLLLPQPKTTQNTTEKPQHCGTYQCQTGNHASHEAPNRFA